MKVVQVTPGRFHHFDLARQLYRFGLLERIYSGFPEWKLRAHGEDKALPREKIATFPWVQAPYMAFSKYGSRYRATGRLRSAWGLKALTTLDSHVARTMHHCDVLIAQSGCGLVAGTRVRTDGGLYICDRGSSHIRHQNALLREEYARWGQSYEGISAQLVEREEAEYAAAQYITVPSQYALESFVEHGVPRSKLRKVAYGVEVGRFEKVAEPPRGSFEILFVGGLTLRKGIPYLLDAFGRLSHPHKRLRMVGTLGADVKEYLGAHPPPPGVEFLGHVPQRELKTVMSSSHVLVLPSLEEGLALVQAQALACGCPVIGTTSTGAADLFTDGREGFIVAPRDSQAILDKLEALAGNESLRREMADRALDRVRALGGWNRYGERMAGLLHETVGVRQP